MPGSRAARARLADFAAARARHSRRATRLPAQSLLRRDFAPSDGPPSRPRVRASATRSECRGQDVRSPHHPVRNGLRPRLPGDPGGRSFSNSQLNRFPIDPPVSGDSSIRVRPPAQTRLGSQDTAARLRTEGSSRSARSRFGRLGRSDPGCAISVHPGKRTFRRSSFSRSAPRGVRAGSPALLARFAWPGPCLPGVRR